MHRLSKDSPSTTARNSSPASQALPHQQALPVLVQQALGGAGIAVEVVEMSLGDEAVQVFQARVVLHQQNHVVGPQLLGVAAGQGAVYLIHPVDVVVVLEAL